MSRKLKIIIKSSVQVVGVLSIEDLDVLLTDENQIGYHRVTPMTDLDLHKGRYINFLPFTN